MEAYPPEYVEHQLPLVLLSGLGERPDGSPNGSETSRQGSGTRLVTTSPECVGDRAGQLLEQLLRQDGKNRALNSASLSGPSGQLRYAMKVIGRIYTLPPRKAAPLPQSPSIEAFANPQGGQPRNTELHSSLSPLSPSSPIYPDGLFTPLWFAKHQRQVPALLIAFFNISADDGVTQNDPIQIDINNIRTALGRSGFKTRFAAVLMSDRSILHAPVLEERLSAIRKATALDLKTGLFFMPPMSSQGEIATFVQSMLATLQPLVVEYYRDLTKHARRKKARGGPSVFASVPAEGGGHALSTPGWNVRYETKQAVFAEFRQEMDVAERHYSAAIDELFSSEGIFEATASWYPRWDDGRLLCDSLALRAIRCQLWTGLTSGATISWVNYKARMKDLVDRRGKGSETYGWNAWESRWAEIMAQLIQRAALPTFQTMPRQAPDTSNELSLAQLYAQPEKAFPAAQGLSPFYLLHHPGYWLRLAFYFAKARHDNALAIPEEDRTPPGQSPASVVAHRARNYDTYLVPQPHEEHPSGEGIGYDHVAQLTRLAGGACREFSARGQTRLSEQLSYELARQMASTGHYSQALELLMPLWEDITWRDDDWQDLLSALSALVHDCALHTRNATVALATAWELLRSGVLDRHPGIKDLGEYMSLDGLSSNKVAVKYKDKQRISPISVSFAFSERDTNVSEPQECQLILVSHAAKDTIPITISHVEIILSNSRVVTISHQPSETQSVDKTTLLDLSSATEVGLDAARFDADLSLQPGHKRIYSFFLTFKEANIVRLQRASLFVDNEAFTLEHTFTDEDLLRSSSVYVAHNDVIEQRLLQHADTTAITVFPKPPKIQILVHGLRKDYYAKEHIYLDVEFVNEEAESANPQASILVSSRLQETPTVRWSGSNDDDTGLLLGSLEAGASYQAGLDISSPPIATTFSVNIEVNYNLQSDPDTTLSKTVTLELNISMPFATKYTLGPLLDTYPWPSYFDIGRLATPERAEGISQKWHLGCLLKSSAPDVVVLHGMKLVVDNIGKDALCTLLDPSPVEGQSLVSGQSMRTDFEIVTRKTSLDDRRPTDLDLLLQIAWSRQADDEEMLLHLPVPRLTLPSSEPRVLCTVAESLTGSGDVVLHYHLENPSTHFLTFALTMEANDDFAFSGPKYRTLSLAPLSRLRVEYQLLLHDPDEGQTDSPEGRWVWPLLLVTDSYYNKHLRVHAGGPRVVLDEKQGIGVLVNPPER